MIDDYLVDYDTSEADISFNSIDECLMNRQSHVCHLNSSNLKKPGGIKQFGR
jgi:hypothetical protein